VSGTERPDREPGDDDDGEGEANEHKSHAFWDDEPNEAIPFSRKTALAILYKRQR
jgi:hypothetical protein